MTTAETAPAMVRKVVGNSVGPLVQSCLQMMTGQSSWPWDLSPPCTEPRLGHCTSYSAYKKIFKLIFLYDLDLEDEDDWSVNDEPQVNIM